MKVSSIERISYFPFHKVRTDNGFYIEKRIIERHDGIEDIQWVPIPGVYSSEEECDRVIADLNKEYGKVSDSYVIALVK